MFVSWLLSPDWTSGDFFGLRTPMYNLWKVVANFIYFVYAILLIVIAIATMFNQKSFDWRQMLPRLALGIILVPFTWWFVQWTISLATYVTASVITIPAETMKTINVQKEGNSDVTSWWKSKSIPKEINVEGIASIENAYNTAKKNCPADCMSPEELLTKPSGIYSYMTVYAYSVFKLDQIKLIDNSSAIDILKSALSVVHQGIIGAIMFIVFGVLTIALATILLVRAIKLWVYAIFSPLFTLNIVASSLMK